MDAAEQVKDWQFIRFMVNNPGPEYPDLEHVRVGECKTQKGLITFNRVEDFELIQGLIEGMKD